MLTATLFDFYGTLVEVPREGARQTIKSWFEIIKTKKDGITLQEAARSATKLWDDYSLGEIQSDRDYVEKFLEKIEIAKNEDLINLLLETWVARGLFVVYPQTNAVINEIKKLGLKIGIISDSPPPWFKKHMTQSGIESLVNATVVSGEVNVKKPDAQIYIKALEKLQSKASEVVFVSDAPSDLMGAHKVGIKELILVSPPVKTYRVGERVKGKFKEKFMEYEELEIRPTVVKNLEEVPNVIRGLLKS